MSKRGTIESFFKRKEKNIDVTVPMNSNLNSTISNDDVEPPVVTTTSEQPPSKVMRVEEENVDTATLIRDPSKRPQIRDYPINQQDEIRRAYITFGPYQEVLPVFPLSGPTNHQRRFQANWFKSFPWLEYSPTEDAAFCFPCYLFAKK